ncbi:Thiol-disulfide isomerase or thioredoxin [Nonomuraea solani]|uniref:Thiol-disulfide isomerase or thioredoxin n=1 Tax=Nonomuraea solani TaxID=1144553 RepID=A0A1H6CIR1_9ACTN|nr:redoxin domain-containing protein [Nonomuraea solani]SEG72840.1 Thiol-disulfide isomerase or thioredoxin [Nonomuraea solani]
MAEAVLAVLLVANLFLTFGVIRRLREHTVRLAAIEHPSESGLGVGAAVPDFHAATTEGSAVSLADLRDAVTVVSFVATGCHSCEEHLPTIRSKGAAAVAGGARALAVVVNVRGERVEADQLIAAVSGPGAVVEESLGGELQRAFGVKRYPSFFLVAPDATIMATPGSASELPAIELRTSAK